MPDDRDGPKNRSIRHDRTTGHAESQAPTEPNPSGADRTHFAAGWARRHDYAGFTRKKAPKPLIFSAQKPPF